MRVSLYVPERLYGFCEADGGSVYFHASAFHRLADGEPPPVMGEDVDVVVSTSTPRDGAAPRATSVRRVASPVKIGGVIKTFDMATGWGFVEGDDRANYFLHRSDVVEARLPIRGQRVNFYGGQKRGRLRACHVEV